MKRHILLLTALFSLLLADLFIGQAREQVHPALESPSGVSAKQYSKDGRGFNEHRMYPLGFSRQGAFAYLSYSANPWRQPAIHLRILSLKTDQQIHRNVFNIPSKDPDAAVRSLISIHGKKISDILYQFDIEATARLPIRKFPLKIAGDIVRADVHRQTALGKSLEECGGRVPEEVQVRIKSSSKGLKVIASYDACASNTPFIEAVEGYLKNPLEDRIVVLASGTQYNSENSWDAKLFPIGAHLTKGF